jgi:hypothetical protein
VTERHQAQLASSDSLSHAVSTHAKWDRCRARNRSGARCRAEGSGISGLCWLHRGALLVNRGRWREPMPTFEVRVGPDGCFIAPDRPSRTWRKPVWPQRVRHWVGKRLVANGQITRGLLHRHEGATFLAELRSWGVVVIDEGPASALVRRVRFEPGSNESGGEASP